MNKLLRVLLLLLLISSTEAQDPDVEFESADPALIFTSTLTDLFREEYTKMEIDKTAIPLKHKIGVIGVYMRIFKELSAEGAGFHHMYPDPQPDFDKSIAQECEQGLQRCIDGIMEHLVNINPWLYPKPKEISIIQLSREIMSGLLNSNMYGVDMSAAQAMCMMSMSGIAAFNQIPFCRFSVPPKSNPNSPDSYSEPMYWPGKVISENPHFLDEVIGEGNECAIKSFCPDPCCHGVNASTMMDSQECRLNTCQEQSKCYMKSEENEDLMAMRSNQWNVSCPCGEGFYFRADVSVCVHDNVCGRENKCPGNHDCINIYSNPGYKCICQLGYTRLNDSVCVPIGYSGAAWSGFALSEPHRNSAPITLFTTFIIVYVIYYLS